MTEGMSEEQARAITEDLTETIGVEGLVPGQLYTKEPGQDWKLASIEEADALVDENIHASEDCVEQRQLLAAEILRARSQRDYEVYCNQAISRYCRQLEVRNEKLSGKLVRRARGIGETRKRLSEVLNPSPAGFLGKISRRMFR